MSQHQPSTNESIEYVAAYNLGSLRPDDPEPVRKFFEDQEKHPSKLSSVGIKLTVAEILVSKRNPKAKDDKDTKLYSAEALLIAKHYNGREDKPSPMKLDTWYEREDQALNAMILKIRANW